MHQSIGVIEVKGLLNAITVADTMAKVANINIRDLERAKGFGWTTIKVEGDVASVKAAVEAGEQIARTSDSFVSMKVIPRPANDVWKVFFPEVQEELELGEELEQQSEPQELVIEEQVHTHYVNLEEPKREKVNNKQDSVKITEIKTVKVEKVTCNLCHDSKCTRKKGDPRQRCMHFNDKK